MKTVNVGIVVGIAIGLVLAFIVYALILASQKEVKDWTLVVSKVEVVPKERLCRYTLSEMVGSDLSVRLYIRGQCGAYTPTDVLMFCKGLQPAKSKKP